MRLERLSRGQVLAAVAALALLLAMATDWWGSRTGDEARRIESTANTRGAEAGEIGRAVQADAQAVAEREERNAWQARGAIDRVLLVLLLLAVISPLAAAGVRASGRRPVPPWTPSTIAVGASLLASLLIAYRVFQEPGVDDLNTIKIGPLLAVLALAGVALGSAGAVQSEYEWADMRSAAAESQAGGATEPQPHD